eukprot:15414268-Alexandrium_andersonii.AAC.1
MGAGRRRPSWSPDGSTSVGLDSGSGLPLRLSGRGRWALRPTSPLSACRAGPSTMLGVIASTTWPWRCASPRPSRAWLPGSPPQARPAGAAGALGDLCERAHLGPAGRVGGPGTALPAGCAPDPHGASP